MPTTDASAPATKGGLRKLKTALHGDMKTLRGELHGDMKTLTRELRGEMRQVKKEIFNHMDNRVSELRGEMKTMKDEIIHQFYVVYEDMRHDLVGANHDEIECLKDKTNDHQKRIEALEMRPV